ncbi:MAG TPA: SRPBCC family protein [Candidatus Nitrosocosmicus sp.]|nr:SRPBCC family protein [Candidatus Nitrosocosmicus sp.]
MTLISTSRKINSSDELIWSIISNIDKDPNFWHGIKAVKNIHREGNTIERETTISFRHSRCIELVTLTPQKQIVTVIREGPIVGTKIINLTRINAKECEIKVEWDVHVKGLMSLFTFYIKKHILKGTNDALERIAKKIER